jgi:lysophospholipase L1-like esterase
MYPMPPVSGGNSDLWLVGDSRMARWNKDLLSPVPGQVKNVGVEGATTLQVLDQLSRTVEIGVPEWIIIEVGINDLKLIGLDKKLSDSIKEYCYRNIISIIELCKENDVNIIVMNIFPNGKIPLIRRLVWNSSVDSAITDINKKLYTYCKSNNIKYFDAFSFLKDERSRVKRIYRDDFLHINQNAYHALSEQIKKEFGDSVKQLSN